MKTCNACIYKTNCTSNTTCDSWRTSNPIKNGDTIRHKLTNERGTVIDVSHKTVTVTMNFGRSEWRKNMVEVTKL